MSRVIFASHGGLSKGMKDSVSMIVGDLAKDVETYSLLPEKTLKTTIKSFINKLMRVMNKYWSYVTSKGGVFIQLYQN